MKIPRPVLVAGLTVLVVAALVAIAVSGPESPRQPGLDPAAPLPAVALPVDSPVPPAPSGSPSRSPAAPTRSPSKHPTPVPSPSPSRTTTDSYEAEAPGNVLGSGARVAPMDGASGGAGVYGIGGRDLGTLTITGVTVPSSGIYQLTIYYQDPDPARPVPVSSRSTTASPPSATSPPPAPAAWPPVPCPSCSRPVRTR